MPVLFVLFSLSIALDLDPIVNIVNSREGVTWKAFAHPRFKAMPLETFRRLNSMFSTPEHLREYRYEPPRVGLPDEFDSVKQWPQCETIGHIYDQGHCGSCWAMATFESLQDRFCIVSKGAQKPLLSGQHITSCATGNSGCNGGWPSSAFRWIQSSGVTNEACIPYQMGTCKHPGCSDWPTPKCNKTCYPNETMPMQKFYAAGHYSVPPSEESIMTELYTHGPVTAAMAVYQDFATYKSGIYHHVTGGMLGMHAVKIIGWGVEGGVKYWKVANSWNQDWGEVGYFRIRKGYDECGIESEIVAGTPKV